MMDVHSKAQNNRRSPRARPAGFVLYGVVLAIAILGSVVYTGIREPGDFLESFRVRVEFTESLDADSVRLEWRSPRNVEINRSGERDGRRIVFSEDSALVRDPSLVFSRSSLDCVKQAVIVIGGRQWRLAGEELLDLARRGDDGERVVSLSDSIRAGRLPLPVAAEIRNVDWGGFGSQIALVLVAQLVAGIAVFGACRRYPSYRIAGLVGAASFILLLFSPFSAPPANHILVFLLLFSLPLAWRQARELISGERVAGWFFIVSVIGVALLSGGHPIVAYALFITFLFSLYQLRARIPLPPSAEVAPATRNVMLILAGVFLAGLFTRLYGLSLLHPYVDEYFHLVEADQRIHGAGSDYTRAPIVTLATQFAYVVASPQSFSSYVFWGRVPSALVGAIGVFVVYWAGSRVDRHTGIVTALLWAIWPWAFSIARTTREYAWYVPLVLLTVVLLYSALELFVRTRVRWAYVGLAWRILVVTGVVLLALSDGGSTLRIVIVFLALTLLGFAVSRWKELWQLARSHPRLFATLAVVSAGFMVLLLRVAGDTGSITVVPQEIRSDAIDHFLQGSPPGHLWRPEAPLLLVVSVLLTGLVAFGRRRAVTVFGIVLLGGFAFYTFFFTRYFRPRYTSYLLPLFLLFVSMGLSGLYRVIRVAIGEHVRVWVLPARQLSAAVTIVVVATVIFSPGFFVHALTYDEHGRHEITDELHYRMDRVMETLRQEYDPGDAVITSRHREAMHLSDTLTHAPHFNYRYSDPDRFDDVAEFMREHPSGLMVLDDERNREWAEGFPVNTSFTHAERTVTPLTRVDGVTIYRWRPTGD